MTHIENGKALILGPIDNFEETLLVASNLCNLLARLTALLEKEMPEIGEPPVPVSVMRATARALLAYREGVGFGLDITIEGDTITLVSPGEIGEVKQDIIDSRDFEDQPSGKFEWMKVERNDDE